MPSKCIPMIEIATICCMKQKVNVAFSSLKTATEERTFDQFEKKIFWRFTKRVYFVVVTF